MSSTTSGTPEWSASLQHLAGDWYAARIHPGPDGKYGDPWVWGCLVRKDGDTAWLSFTRDAPTPAQLNAGMVVLRGLGFTRYVYERYEDGRPRHIRRRL
jgi:hypothetical protein